ncbi:MAG: nucleotidyl transferase AbiEii/AbiGii toxin family protein [Hydrogenovibrio sp.]|uniref:nucleotidyl transferase AbiEii/AbiGii toxin family protein n=1 Tax=Hydrogenovibrio sp. TaxID=2065821 RepID=UPI00286FD69C|nr:nucleotidyl transferase AbiEii/AbiGii toxin family protein [Hydrogenovibrio sp.]MDR9498539.1 nucleotidyl transferase AbiEii/AbiGii toxin family protein [Hydrogenovibrio sp.]MDR9499231.1 nucleotidyl transferase AbiEii/AbiGii toxin family protein [Hydrogenovibrio sp.]
MLKTEVLPERTRKLFEEIRYDPVLADFTLIGGTAISLLVGHRSSMDLDFCTFEQQLPVYKIDQFIQFLKNDGHQVFDATEPNKQAQFKINTGKNLADFARDYVIDGVKVTFFAYDAPNKTKAFLASQDAYRDLASFKIMSLKGLFTTKCLLPERRNKSRDLFDLWYLIDKEGFSVDDMFDVIESYSDSMMIDHTVYVLTGEDPVDDETDEGLDAVDVEMSLEALYVFFDKAISQYQQARSEKSFLD